MKKQQIDDIEEGGMVELEEDGMVWRTVEKDVNKGGHISSLLDTNNCKMLQYKHLRCLTQPTKQKDIEEKEGDRQQEKS